MLTFASTIAASSARLAEFYIAGDKLSSGSMDITCKSRSNNQGLGRRLKVADVVAPAVYYTHIEASLGLVTVSIPALRPLFRGKSPERMLASIRGYLSLHTSQSSSSHQNLREKEPEQSMTSTLQEQASKVHPMPQVPPSVYSGPAQNGAFVVRPESEVHGERTNHLPANGIAVGRTWETTTDIV